jgi:hypothetical protein
MKDRFADWGGGLSTSNILYGLWRLVPGYPKLTSVSTSLKLSGFGTSLWTSSTTRSWMLWAGGFACYLAELL